MLLRHIYVKKGGIFLIIHIVKQSETVWGIARLYGVSPQRIIADNGLSGQQYLVVGQALIILIPETVHTVKEGETLFTISRIYGISEMELMQKNPATVISRLVYPGEQLVIRYRDEEDTPISIYGFVYTNVNENTLKRTLPFVSNCAIFGYGFRPDGTLLAINDSNLIDTMYRYRTGPFMLITSLTENGNFDSSLASALFNDMELQEKVIGSILAVMQEKGYIGLDIDFEYINAEDRDAFSAFVSNITQQLNAAGYTVNVDLAPKTSSQQSGTLYEGHDYAALGAAANTVLLMTYEWGYSYGPPRAVAPINEVRRVVEYAVTEIPNEKIYMGIPNYAYDWELPYKRGETRARGIGNETAVRIAAENGAEIMYSQRDQTPFFEYTAPGGAQHVVWFEDVRSIAAKYEIIDEFNLRGAGYWNLMNPFAQNWAYVGYKYDIAKLEV